jgi:RimJ/RimL family protein N-acetyltransferase
LQLGFEQLGLHRVFGVCLASNAGSARVMEKVGMRREEHFRESRWMLGCWQDILLYAILGREWQAERH